MKNVDNLHCFCKKDLGYVERAFCAGNEEDRLVSGPVIFSSREKIRT